jgi:FkbM family methyltransferase
MHRLLTHASNFSSFWKLFGFKGALDVGRGRKSGSPVYFVRASACRRPLWVRRDSSDFEVLQQAVEFRRGFLPYGYVPQTVLDLGANTGLTSSVFAARWPQARVVAVEPELRNFELLQRNCAPAANITPVRGAVWPHDGEVGITNPTERPWGFRVDELAGTHSGTEQIPAFSIPTLMVQHSFKTLDVVKMDIEGAEKVIFEANPIEWLSRVRVLIVEVHDRFLPGCSEALAGAVAPLPHQHFVIDEYDVFHFNSTRG